MGTETAARERTRRLRRREVMACRSFVIEGTDPLQRITVRMGWPRKMRGETDFVCPVEMVGWGETRVRPMRGRDVFEAIQLGLILIGTELKFLDEESNGGVRWADGSRFDIGFPVYPDFSMAPIMDVSEQGRGRAGRGTPEGGTA